MGFNKIYIDEENIFNAWKSESSQGVANLFIKYDGHIIDTSSKVPLQIERIMSKEITLDKKLTLIETYFTMLFEGLIKIK